MARNGGRQRLRDFVVGLHDGVGDVALLFAEQACGGDVHVKHVQARGDVRQDTAAIVLLDHDAVVFAGQAHVDAVEAADDGRAAADALAAHGRGAAGCVHYLDVHGVGVVDIGIIVARHEFERKPR